MRCRAILFVSLFAAACSSVDDPQVGLDAGVPAVDAGDPPADAGPADQKPIVALQDLGEYAPARGNLPLKIAATDDRGIERLELFVGASTTAAVTKTTAGQASPFSMTWNTTSTPDGIVPLFVRATDTTGQTTDSAPVKVYVVNGGEEAVWMDGRTGTIEIPADYDPASGIDLDAKNHWNNPAGVKRIVAIASWAAQAGGEPWNIELTVGSGECPHSGHVIGEAKTSTASPIMLEVEPTAGEQKTGMHFVHLGALEPVAHKGQSLPYEIRVYLFK